MLKSAHILSKIFVSPLPGSTILALLLLITCSNLRADENTNNSQSDQNNIYLLDMPHRFLSNRLLGFSDRIDQIFSNTENFDKKNTSYARLSLASAWQDQGRPTYLTDAYIFFALPRTQDKYSLLVQTDTSEESKATGFNLLPGSPAQRSNALAIRGNIATGDNWSTSADIGSKLSTRLDPFIRVRYMQTNQFENWSLLWHESVYKFLYLGSGIDSRVNLDYPVNDQYHLRFSNQLSLLEQNNFIDHSHSLALFQRLTAKSAIAYAVGFYTLPEPSDEINYIQLRYKALLHKTWLYYELIPEYIYPRSTNFTATPRFTLKFEMLLGNP